MAMCIYAGCTSVQKPFSSVSFFGLPKDSRRQLWIENSGNQELKSLPQNAKRFVCEKHFSPKSLRKQFLRTTVRSDAVPEKWCGNSNALSGPDARTEEVTGQTLEEMLDWHHRLPPDSLPDDGDVELNVIEITEQSSNCSQSSIEIGPDPDVHDDSVEFLDDENKQIDEEEAQVFEAVNSEKSQHEIPSTFYEGEEVTESELDVEIVNTGKRKLSVDFEDRATKMPRECSEEVIVIEEAISHQQGESVGCEVVVSSSCAKCTEIQTNSSTSNAETSNEDKYFVLSLVGILQRISPKKRAFAKLNIMRY